jgi:hypothetical protein
MKMFSAKPPGRIRDRGGQKIQCFSPQNKLFSLFISFSPFNSLELVTTKAFHQKNELFVSGRQIDRNEGSCREVSRDLQRQGGPEKRRKGLSLFPRILGKGPMINPSASELVLINSFIILLIMVDGIIRIGTAK